METGSPAFMPAITANEYLRFPPEASSISVPPASISEMCEPIRANATGVRS